MSDTEYDYITVDDNNPDSVNTPSNLVKMSLSRYCLSNKTMSCLPSENLKVQAHCKDEYLWPDKYQISTEKIINAMIKHN